MPVVTEAAVFSGFLAFVTALFAAKTGFRLPERPPEKLNPDPPGAPRIGGIFVFLALVTGLFLLPPAWIGPDRWIVMIALMGIFAIGFADDLRPVNCYVKLLFQLAPAVLVAFSGLAPTAVSLPGIGNVMLGKWAIPLTIFWLASTANAYNLIDGVDGLATGLGLIAAAALALLGWANGSEPSVAFGLLLSAALFGILVFMINPSRFYLGDSGSLTVGFSVGLLALLTAQGAGTLQLAPVLLALAVPLGDMAFAIVRRAVHGHHPFHRDHGHIHHRLQRLGLSARHVSLALWLLGGSAAAVGLWIVRIS